MAHFDLAALLLALAAALSWLNFKVLRLPHEIGLVVTGLAVSLLLVVARHLIPGRWTGSPLAGLLGQVDFTDVVMNGMLAFLIFAGALTLDLQALKRRAFTVATLAVVGTALSTAVVGVAFWEAARLIGHPLSLAWALVFGALISPTDPVAVVSTLKHVRIPAAIETEMQGEALFNDGIGIVIFTVLVGFARRAAATPGRAASRSTSCARRAEASRSASASATRPIAPCGRSTTTRPKC